MTGQQVHDKVLNVTHYQGNATQNHNEKSPHACQSDYQPKANRYKSYKGCGETGASVCCKKVNCCSHSGKQYGGSLKIKNRITM